MKSNVGVWLDHRKAFIVRERDGVEETHELVSDVEKHVRYSGGRPEDQMEHRFTNHLNEYYASVISHLQDADAILILGPGEAKGELHKRLSLDPSGPRIVSVETVDKMTDQQITAKVRDHFRVPGGDVQHRNAGADKPYKQKEEKEHERQ
jgi:hypothetical protein